MRALAIAFVILATSGTAATADPITYRFSGTVTSSLLEGSSSGFKAAVGDPFSGFLSLPSQPADTNPSPNIGDFEFDSPAFIDFGLTVGTSGISAQGPGFAEVRLDGRDHLALFDARIPSEFTDEDGNPITLEVSLLFENEVGPPFLRSDALPTAADLNRASSRFLLLGPDNFGLTPFVEGAIQTVSGGPAASTPEPASVFLVGSVLMAAGVQRWRRVRLR
jgi:hypothetical protein